MPDHCGRGIVAARLDAQKGKGARHVPPLIAYANAGNTLAMVRQSQPIILLTRPQAQSERFAAELGLPALISPLMAAEFLTPPHMTGHFAAVVLTSETGVEAAQRISMTGQAMPLAAYCVGRRTADAAEVAGFTVLTVASNMAALSEQVLANPPQGVLLILRAEDSAGDLENITKSAGIETVSAITYRQKACLLSPQAEAVLSRIDPVLVPLFSPRSAQLFAAEYRRIGAKAPLLCVAISQATADAFDMASQEIRIARKPNGPSMRCEVLDLLKDRLGS